MRHWKSLSTALTIVLAVSLAAAEYQPQKQHSDGQRDEKIAMTWYTSWHMNDFPLDQVPWSTYDIVSYALV